jgi:hypothetical protein
MAREKAFFVTNNSTGIVCNKYSTHKLVGVFRFAPVCKRVTTVACCWVNIVEIDGFGVGDFNRFPVAARYFCRNLNYFPYALISLVQ